jgi:hypothetical protein
MLCAVRGQYSARAKRAFSHSGFPVTACSYGFNATSRSSARDRRGHRFFGLRRLLLALQAFRAMVMIDVLDFVS